MAASTTMGYSAFQDKDLQQSVTQDTANKNDLKIFNQSIMREDAIQLSLEMMQSQGPGYYHMDNQYGSECGLEEARGIQVSQPGVNFKGGMGWTGEKGCLVDIDSELRENKNRLTNKNQNFQLTERLSLTTPNLKKGFFDVDVESVIQAGDLTTTQRACGPLSGVTIGNYFLPMIEKLEKEVQDTNHIIPEDSKQDWVRGGLPTREMIRNEDYLRRCQEKTAPTM